MPRAEFSRKTKRIIWERANEMCEGLVVRDGNLTRCCAPLMFGRFHYDHIDPDFMSKRNDPENGQLLCLFCHDEKTRLDQGNIAKVKRLRDKQIKAKTSKRPMPHGRNSLTKRKIGGAVVPR